MPTPGVNITNIKMINVTGTAQSGAENYYILLATPSSNASTWTFQDVSITGGANSTCDSLPPNFTCS